MKPRPTDAIHAARKELPFKVCCRCNIPKLREFFCANKSSSDGLNNFCNECESNRQRLKRTGWTPEEWKSALEEQEGKCWICKIQPENESDLVADHCAKTGKKRRILCRKCNGALGSFLHNASLLRRAAQYIEDHDG